MSNVIVISFNEDGDPPKVEELSKEAFCKRLDEHYYGENPTFAKAANLDTAAFAGLLVIEGKIVQPRAVKVTTRHEL